MFREHFALSAETTVLDVGSEAGHNIHAVLADTPVRPENVSIADIGADAVEQGAALYGFTPVVLDESGRLPFDDGSFDIVYCSSVIEHVTVPKSVVWSMRSGDEFKRAALERQAQFASELTRVGRSYYLQTPYRHFPVESHSWLPFVAWLPRPALLAVLRFTNRFWVKRTDPDWYLLDRRQLESLFPGSEIIAERSLGLTKSLMVMGTRDR
ncbi:MAG: methyltransferase domain-containing protein [Coriobacteriia bacterium]|nr:methyltransferase domain-containing protein [Coriobacteriia bacterium]